MCYDKTRGLLVLIKCRYGYVSFINLYWQEIKSFLFANLVVDASEMSSKLMSCPAENGEHPRSKMENRMDSMAAPALSTYTPEEMVQQMKELITENNELKGECACELVLKCKSLESLLWVFLFHDYEFCACLPLLDNILCLGSICCINDLASGKADLIGHIKLNWYGRLGEEQPNVWVTYLL